MPTRHNPPSLIGDSANSIVDISTLFLDGVAWEWNLDTGKVTILTECCHSLLSSNNLLSNNYASGNNAATLLSGALSSLRDEAIAICEQDLELDKIIRIKLNYENETYRIRGSRKKSSHITDAFPVDRVLLGVCSACTLPANLSIRILDNFTLPVCLQDSDQRYIYANKKFLKLAGLSLSRIMGRSPLDFSAMESGAYLLGKLVCTEQMQDDEANSVVEMGRDVAISNRIYHIQQHPLRIGDYQRTYILSTLYDVDRIRSLEQESQHRIAQSKALFDLMPVLIIYFDKEQKVQVVNRKIEALFERSGDELKGKTLFEVVPDWPPVRDVEKKIAEVFKTRESVHRFESAFRRGSAKYWVKIELFPIFDIDGEVENVLMLVSDISSLHRHKEKLAEQDARARAMMANSFESMYSLTIEPPMPMSLGDEEKAEWFLKYGYYSDCNLLCAQSIGKTIEEVIDHRFVDVVGSDSQIKKVVKFAVGNDFKFNNQVFEFIDNGRRIWWEYSIKPNIRDGQLLQFWGSSRDITEDKLKSIELQDNEARYRSFIANSHEGIFHGKLKKGLSLSLDKQAMIEGLIQSLVITECNDEYLRQHGNKNRGDIVDNFYREIEPLSVVHRIISKFVESNFQLSRLPVQLDRNADEKTWCSVNLVGLVSENKLIGCWGTQRDITERYHYLQRLEHQANHDSLTKLPNRQKLYADLEHHLAHPSKEGVLALILLDLDRFKEINDTLGHHIGDLLLKELGPRLQIIVSQMHGMVARLGGDEFAIMLPDIIESDVKEVALRLFEAVNPAFNLEGFQAEVKASIGIALSPKHASDVSGLMRYADIAMYQAKNEALGVLEYDPSLDSYTPRRLSLMHDLGKAIREDQLVLHYQPKIDVSGKFVRGFEALLRWNHPEHGFLPPSEFITLAESTENIRPLTLWVLDAALAQCKVWRDKKLDIKMAVNLSARNLLDETIVDFIRQALQKHNVPADALELEITESAIMIDPKRAADVMRLMGDLGLHLSIDDYGTGYSSLAYLKSLPVDTLKIDYSFVKDMLVEKHDAIIVHSTINLAHNLGLKVVAEGVESEAILHELDVMGCDLAQGYYVARPMPASAAEVWLRESGWSSLAMF